MVAGVLGGSALVLAAGDGVNGLVWLALGAVTCALAAVGWMDDRKSLPVHIRMPIHLLCGAAVAALAQQILPVGSAFVIPWILWCVFWTVAAINVVNFMDGIDGMVAAQGLVYGAYLAALLPMPMAGSWFGLVLAAACAAFLLVNWAPASIFMGDVASGPLGLFLVVGGVLALEGARIWFIYLPLFPLFYDSLATILRRARRGERLTDAHRSHLYQRLANGAFGHARVSAGFGMAAAVGAAIGLSAPLLPPAVQAALLASYVGGSMFAWRRLDAWCATLTAET